ncbi:MAG: GNAT family N-acetyltransferase [Sporocytophaga sp.]|uniref:GNAT family N-acetyltransferase n=1 Tax=Sporocytophaga sp. TaxID=2231183 RepID=UPI001B23433F|nr:GNAT family N-acetyltransferase [Sporocytophaga sp.]MBO9700120.1 GNAT family N-acetyltransferase [Sporocytophaga sp.]
MEITFRNISDDDYPYVISNLNSWWDGRAMVNMLPRLFFKYFKETGFVAIADGKVLGFIIGFFSQDDHRDAYVHFVGVDPGYRNYKIGKRLYDFFVERVQGAGVEKIFCVTSPFNKNSIAFHKRIGFEIMPGSNKTVDGVDFFSDYDGNGEDRVLFVKYLV